MLAVCGGLVRGEVLRVWGVPHVFDLLRRPARQTLSFLQGSHSGRRHFLSVSFSPISLYLVAKSLTLKTVSITNPKIRLTQYFRLTHRSTRWGGNAGTPPPPASNVVAARRVW